MTTTNQETHRTTTRDEANRPGPAAEPTLSHKQWRGYGALPALLDFWSLCDFIGMRKDRSTRLFAWRGAKNGSFPAPVKLSEARIAWRRDEVEAWLSNRPRAIYSKATEPPEAEPERPAERIDDKVITITQTPTRCVMCDSTLTMIAPSVYSCTDNQNLNCTWAARVLPGDGDAA